MTQSSSISRRDMILASGIIVSGLSQSARVQAQSPEAKDLIFRTTDPRNAEPELGKLVQTWITPTKWFYIRSHGANPAIDPNTFRLRVEGLVDKPLVLSLQDLKKYAEHTVTATLTCAGNRRAEFNKEAAVGGVQWEAGAIGNATWTGVALADILNAAGVQQTAKHVWMDGLDEVAHEGGSIPFGASIPIEKAMAAEGEVGALLAYAMNEKPLEADHGFPLRSVVPGYIGARSVKWLGKIVVSDRTSPNHYLADAYKIVKGSADIDWSEAGPIYRFPINAAISPVAPNAALQAGPIELSGYVVPSGIHGTKIDRVLVSVDAGKTWAKADLTGQEQDYCWQLWKTTVTVGKDTKELIVRATDSSGGFMPARVPWNAKGYLQNSWYRLPIQVN